MALDRQHSNIVIIGGVACGPKTAATLARRSADLSITVFQKEPHISYGTCGMPYYASGDINSFDDLTMTSYDIPRNPEFFKQTKGFDVIPQAEVTGIDREKKIVEVTLLESGDKIEHGYDTLVIATGAVTNTPPFPVPDSPKVRPFTRPDDAIGFRKLAETGQVGKALVIGGGFIGCELAEAAGSLWGIETLLVEKEPQLLPYVLDPEMAAIAQREMIRQEIEVITGAMVQKVELDDNDNPVVHIEGREPITVDYVFMCLGVHPETSLAKACGLAIGETGGIKVDEHLRTSNEHIYAGGDCIESVHRLTGHPLYIPMGSLANRHGRVIAENIIGNEMTFDGVVGAFLVKVFDTNVGSVGLSEQAAQTAGLNAAAVWGSFPDKPDYYPESDVFTAKLVYDPESKRVLGLQAAGTGDICRRVDVMSALLQNNATLDNILAFEHGYAPPYSEALDPLHHLAGIALAKMRGIDFASPDISNGNFGNDTQWLDVREAAEIEAQPWPPELLPGDFKTIPLNDLRSRHEELDPARPVAILCKRGPRSYQAAVILNQLGFDRVSVISGGYQGSQV